MARMLRLILLGLLSTAMIACGKTDEQKAQDHAKDLSSEESSLISYLANTSPNVTWSDSQFDDYEAHLTRLEQVENELRSMDGSNGISVNGVDNTAAIETDRRLAEQMRAEMHREQPDKQARR